MILLSYIWLNKNEVEVHEMYMSRCLHLASLGAGKVAPNPMVGSVLVYGNRIIGEGYHKMFGQAHAEVNCIHSVAPEDRHLIKDSTLYVSLEPCSHFGKTPPCTDLIIKHEIKNVVVGSKDPFPEVNGKGIEILKALGVNVLAGILEKECDLANRRFLAMHQFHRPYIILKWAQTADGKIANADNSRLMISNPLSSRLVHKWRSEEASILVGTNTARFDDPQLNTRFWKGNNPLRLVVDLNLRLSSALKLFDHSIPTLVFNYHKQQEQRNLVYHQVSSSASLVQEILKTLYQLKINSVLVEGGSKLLQSFINEGLWDEARIITSSLLRVPGGLPSPVLSNEELSGSEQLGCDTINYYTKASKL